MGTPAMIIVKDSNRTIIARIYSTMDGYPESKGKALFELLDGLVLTNGLSLSPSGAKTANGLECLAAQLVEHFKDGPGGVYLTSARWVRDYEYHVGLNKFGSLIVKVVEFPRTKLFEGTVPEYGQWLKKQHST